MTVLTVIISLYFNKTKKNKLFLFALRWRNIFWVIKLGEIKSDQKYFASWIRKSWKPQKILPQFESFSTNVPICRGFSTGFLFTVLWFNWSLKKLCLAKVLLTIWEIPLHEDNRNYNSQRFSYKFAFILFFSFLINQKLGWGFQQEIFLFFLSIVSDALL